MTVVITGATSGIGKKVAENLCKDEVSVVAMGRNQTVLDTMISSWARQDQFLDTICGDITIEGAEIKLKQQIKCAEELSLVCSAGIGASHSAEGDFERYKEILDVNLNGSVRMVMAVLPKMLELGGGNIVLISSMAGVKGYKRNTAYCASKAGLIGFGRALAQEHSKRGIRVYMVCPGMVATPMTEKMISNMIKIKQISRGEAEVLVVSNNPQKVLIPVEEVAGLVCDLVKGKYPSLAGQPILMGGGE